MSINKYVEKEFKCHFENFLFLLSIKFTYIVI